MRIKAYWTIILLVLLWAVRSLAGPDQQAYSEHKTSRYLVRISSGPGEPHSVGSCAIRIYEMNGLDLVAGIIRPRDGELAQSWIAESSGGRRITVFVWTRVVGTGAYGTLELLEFNGKAFRQRALPPVEKSLLHGYMGHDLFDVVNGMIYRQFPLYRPEDSNSNPTGGTRCLELKLGEKKWKLSNNGVHGRFASSPP